MTSHHHKHKIKLRRLRLLQVLCMILSGFLLFFGTGEMFQGSSITGIVMIGLAAILIITALSIKTGNRHK